MQEGTPLPPRKRRRARSTNQVVARTVTVRRPAIPTLPGPRGLVQRPGDGLRQRSRLACLLFVPSPGPPTACLSGQCSRHPGASRLSGAPGGRAFDPTGRLRLRRAAALTRRGPRRLALQGTGRRLAEAGEGSGGWGWG